MLKSKTIQGLFLLQVALLGCGQNKDLTASALSQRLNGESAPPPICVSAGRGASVSQLPSETAQPDFWELSGSKLHLEENKLRLSSVMGQSVDPILQSGLKLDVEYDVSCLLEKQHLSPISAYARFPRGVNPEGLEYWTQSLELASEIPTSALHNIVEADDCVRGVSRSGHMTTQAAPNDPQYSSQQYMNTSNLKAANAWDRFYDQTNGIKSDVIIAVIDSGVDIAHEDLRDSLWVNSDETPGNGVDDDNNGYVDDVNGFNMASNIPNPSPQVWSSQAGGEAHGTHVAGVAMATENNGRGIAGVNGKFGRVMSLNVFGASPNGDNAVIARAIDYARENGAHVINMSLGGQSPSSAILAAVNRAVSAGVIVIVAAGNSNCDMSNPGSGTCPNGGSNYFSPGASNAEIPVPSGRTDNGFISVGAINQSGGSRCSFSNYGASVVEYSAPGCTGILSTVPGNRYVASGWSGTSMASPLVAGAASLVYGIIRDRSGTAPSPALVEEVMKSGARKTGLTSFFEQGNALDLMALADEVDRRWPVAGSGGGDNPPPPPACP